MRQAIRVALAVVKDATRGWSRGRNATQAAALAFYSAFSLAPMLVIVIAVAGAVFGMEAAQGRLYAEIAALVGKDGAAVVQTMVANAWKADTGGITAVASVGAIVLGASATFSQLHMALNQVWEVRPQDRPLLRNVLNLLRVRLMSFGLVMGVGFLLLVLLVVDTALGFLLDWVWGTSDISYWALKLAQRATSLLLLSLTFALLIRELSDVRPRWRHVFGGAFVGALLFSVGKRLFGMYLARAGTADAFGAAGSLAVLLMWLYFSAAVFLFGAQIAAASSRLAANGGSGQPAGPGGVH